jgi:hypothetical protein
MTLASCLITSSMAFVAFLVAALPLRKIVFLTSGVHAGQANSGGADGHPSVMPLSDICSPYGV